MTGERLETTPVRAAHRRFPTSRHLDPLRELSFRVVAGLRELSFRAVADRFAELHGLSFRVVADWRTALGIPQLPDAPLAPLARVYLERLKARGAGPELATSSAVLAAYIALATERGFTTWRQVGPATLSEHFARCAGAAHRTVLRDFYAFLAARGVPVGNARAWLGEPRRRGAQPAGPRDPVLWPAVARFLEWCRTVRRLSPATCKHYQLELGRLSAFVSSAGVTAWRALKPAHIDRYLDTVRAAGRTTAYACTAVGRFLVQLDVAGERPFDWLPSRDAPSSSRLPRVLSVDEARHLLESVRGEGVAELRNRAVLELLYASGLRAGEVLGLRVADVDLAERTVRVIGKGDRERRVPFGQYAERALCAYLERARPLLVESPRTPTLFVTWPGRPLTRVALAKMLSASATAAGLGHVHPHQLRHTCATHLLAGGADLRVVQEVLGHASITTTQLYTHLVPRQLVDTLRAHHPRWAS